MEPTGSGRRWGLSPVLEQSLVDLPSPWGLPVPKPPLKPATKCGATRGRGDGARGGEMSWLVRAVGSIGDLLSGGQLAKKAPYVLLKDTAMVSTAFSNSRLSVSLLDS